MYACFISFLLLHWMSLRYKRKRDEKWAAPADKDKCGGNKCHILVLPQRAQVYIVHYVRLLRQYRKERAVRFYPFFITIEPSKLVSTSKALEKASDGENKSERASLEVFLRSPHLSYLVLLQGNDCKSWLTLPCSLSLSLPPSLFSLESGEGEKRGREARSKKRAQRVLSLTVATAAAAATATVAAVNDGVEAWSEGDNPDCRRTLLPNGALQRPLHF